jgi:hypothetical protein
MRGHKPPENTDESVRDAVASFEESDTDPQRHDFEQSRTAFPFPRDAVGESARPHRWRRSADSLYPVEGSNRVLIDEPEQTIDKATRNTL